MRGLINKQGSIFLLIALSVTYSIYFTSSITIIKYAPAASAVFLCLFSASIIGGVVSGRAAFRQVSSLFNSARDDKTAFKDLAYMATSGFALGVSFYLQLVERSSFAPSGSDVAFLLTTTALFALILSVLFKRERMSFGKVVGCITALLGVVALVGNWEYPSSFSPFALFPYAESLILISSIALGLFMVITSKLIAKYPSTVLVTISLWFATVAVFVIAMISNGPLYLLRVPAEGWYVLFFTGIAGIFLPTLFLNDLLRSESVARAATAFLFLPVIITSMIGIEKAFGLALMVTPFKWGSVVAASVIITIGAAAIWLD